MCELDIHQKRELDKIGLEMYFLDKTNMFDVAVDKLIDDLKKVSTKSWEEFEGWHKFQDTDPERYAELSEQAERYEINIAHQQHDTLLDIIYDEEKLLSLVEMKIIYAFKFLEINIKKLLRGAFSLASTQSFYKWENLIKFLKDKSIDIKNFESYQDIIQLKKVNNTIKHSDDYETSLSEIQEFKNSDKISYQNLDHFYKRVAESTNIFLQELSSAIYDELYEFNDIKIDELAKSLVLRMKKEDALKLTEKINGYYK